MSDMSITAACDKCVFFDGPDVEGDGACFRNPKPALKWHSSWCGEFEPKRKHYWWPNGNSSMKPKILWPGDDEDA